MLCDLHRIRLATKLPFSCPAKEIDPVQQIGTMKDEAFLRMDPTSIAFDPHMGLHLLHRVTVCGACLSRNLANWTVQLLRRSCR